MHTQSYQTQVFILSNDIVQLHVEEEKHSPRSPIIWSLPVVEVTQVMSYVRPSEYIILLQAMTQHNNGPGKEFQPMLDPLGYVMPL